ncbi:CHAT domain-containing protein [Aquimarina sp. 2201CG5-10]|uniref:CHAT domain-containing protein n=1 Tax=Aquimarina callyspongiae TaxID=3098150 RepID=UPI002AB5A786|nr:CHAT domain-containing protein [Aquimarina sp. 2201CG5-10]MDY8135724.1 CHAT domain-containing protein [Aquimarina sp. 2201CG5-10]
MKQFIFFFVLIVSVCWTDTVKAQHLFEYYQSMLDDNDVTIQQLESAVDSIIGVYQREEKYLDFIKVAHDFSKELYKGKLYSKAIKYAQKEITTYQKLGLQNEAYVNAVYNLGFFYYKNKDFNKSITCYKEVVQLNLDEYSTAKAFCEIGKYYGQKGDFFKSEDYYIQGIFILEKLGRKKLLIKKYLAFALVLDKIEVKESLEKKKEILDKAAKLFEEVPTYSLRDFYSLNNSYANYYNVKLDFTKAKEYYAKNLKEALKSNDSTLVCASCINMSDLYLNPKNSSNKDSTLNYLNKGLEYCRQKSNISIGYHQLSAFYQYKNQYSKALQSIQKSLSTNINIDESVNSSPDYDDLLVSEDKYGVLLALIQKATILIQLHQEEKNEDKIRLALKTLLVADELVDILVENSTEEGSKLYWRKEASQIYLKGILICELLDEKERSFYFSEKNRALLLIEDILENAEKIQLPSKILKRENELKKQILSLESLISNEKNIDTISILRDKRFKLKQEYQNQKDSLQISFPGYYNQRVKTETITLQKVQKTLNPETVIVSYISNDDPQDDRFSSLYAVLVSNKTTELVKIGKLSAVEDLIIDYRKLLSKPFETDEDQILFKKTASRLYAILFPKNKIQTVLDHKHLVIIPDGKLQYIPFESLVVDSINGKYLIENNEISYAYSMSFLYHNTNIDRNPSKNMVSFAPITFTHDNLEEINYSTDEVKKISEYVSIDSYLEKEASKENFLSKATDYSIIHLATHANFSENLQIAFYDTNLEYHELYTSKNQAELVVLSACNTSLGEIAKGEGVMSLARGFFYAGSNTVISSFWNANDKSTSQIMESFYQNLDSGQTKSKALHNAKIQYLKSSSLSDASPYYWATFVLIGDSETSLFASNNSLYLIILFIFLSLIVSYLLFFIKKR